MGTELRISPGVVLASIDQDESDKNGFRTSYTFTGTRIECEAQRWIERGRGAKAIQLRPKGDGNWELVSTYPYDAETGGGSDVDQPVDTHELDVSMAQQDVFLNPKLQSTLSTSLQQKLQNLTLRYKQGEWKSPDAAIAAVNAATGSDATTLNYFKLIAFKNVDHWIFYRSVYSRIITAATPAQVQASFTGVQKLWTTAQLLAWESVPNDWWFTLPSYVWHKSQPKVTTNIGASSKTQISYQYIASDEASTLLYDNY